MGASPIYPRLIAMMAIMTTMVNQPLDIPKQLMTLSLFWGSSLSSLPDVDCLFPLLGEKICLLFRADKPSITIRSPFSLSSRSVARLLSSCLRDKEWILYTQKGEVKWKFIKNGTERKERSLEWEWYWMGCHWGLLWLVFYRTLTTELKSSWCYHW